ncbi:PREDICTED: uncharacterized protein LOC104820211 [Tarenaya hassleriana]|uniref:uncharacterized protein LOC104820211 n=1 Tax=Tarenaya hassleriana TaxID=28532 RepID=UPI00053C9AB1|nr:PREDICTED: uncharacterized protein LOC104820211 [Tarenaya hassleriana]
MGKATRWLKGLFGFKPSCSSSDHHRRSSAVGLCDTHENISEREATWIRSRVDDTFNLVSGVHLEWELARATLEMLEKKEKVLLKKAAGEVEKAKEFTRAKNKRAAAAVVRLTGRSGPLRRTGREKLLAATKIQCAFRGYLARKALRALRGVVKIQALVRGYLVRRQAAATLRSMEALVRAQATVKLHRSIRRSGYAGPPRKSMEKFSGCLENRNNGEETAKIVEVDTGTRPRTYKTRRPASNGSDLTDDPFRRTFSSPLSGRIPPRLSIPKPDWDDCSSCTKFPTAQSTPRIAGGSPSISACFSVSSRGGGRWAKLRSHSAPRQRPEATSASGESGGRDRRRSVGGGGGARVHRPSCSGVREDVVGKIDRLRVQW